jgi:carbonic anhydrase
MLIHHTRCGMLGLSDEDVKAGIEADTGVRPSFSFAGFDDLDGDVRESIARVKASPFLPDTSGVRGFVYEVESGRLREVV